MTDFDRALEFIFKWEGKGITDPSPGYDGNDEENCGIDESRNPDLEVENLTESQIRAIYKERYWDAIKGDTFMWPENIILFNAAVNCGVSRALDWLGQAEQKGWREIMLLQISHYTKLANNQKYKPYFLGWMNRVCDLYHEVNE